MGVNPTTPFENCWVGVSNLRDLIRSHQIPSDLIRYPIARPMRYPTADLIRSHLISCDLIESRAIRCLVKRADVMTPQKGPPAVEKHEHDLRAAFHSDVLFLCYDEIGRKSSGNIAAFFIPNREFPFSATFKQMHSKYICGANCHSSNFLAQR